VLVSESTILIGLGSVLAGMLGALTGLGGGIIVVPMLTVLFGVDIRYAAGAALISVIATSSGAAAAYLKEGYTNMRIGMFLEVATTTGAICGAALAAFVPIHLLSIIFGCTLLLSAYLTSRKKTGNTLTDKPDPIAQKLKLDGSFPSDQGIVTYHVYNVPGGFVGMWFAGLLSGLLGIGSGALKVLAMDQVMRVPFKVSTTTSNFMIGVTAAASAGIYLHRGYVDPLLVAPVMLGVLGGAMLGAKILTVSKTSLLRTVFTYVLIILALQMIFSGVVHK
jgi:uncharacterized membrane protein YfcA